MLGHNKSMHSITFILLIIGGLNWLLQGIFGWDIGSYLPGGMQGWASRIIYILVGLSAIYELAMHKTTCKLCEGKMQKPQGSMPSSNM